jgi:hypothetical protein
VEENKAEIELLKTANADYADAPARPMSKPKLLLLPDLIEQWADEILRFSPGITPCIYHDDSRARKASKHCASRRNSNPFRGSYISILASHGELS